MIKKLSRLFESFLNALVANDPSDLMFGSIAVQGLQSATPLAAPTGLAKRAKHIQSTLGTKSAAGFLRNREVSLDEALEILRK